MSGLNYPLKFKPIYLEKVWGGNKLNSVLNKDSPYEKTGESWEISAVKNNFSVIENGEFKGNNLKELCLKLPLDLMGQRVNEQFKGEFPLLIKFLDAAVPLSVQVHPDDAMAAEYDSFGKNEMWVILDSGKDGKIYLGFKENESPETVREAIQESALLNKIETYFPKKYDAFLIKSGTIHTVGGNILLAEVQQTSDLTFRLFDFDRSGAEKRELHIEEGLRALNYAPEKNLYIPNNDNRRDLADNQYFKVNKIRVEKSYSTSTKKFDSFVIYMNLEGTAEIVTQGTTTPLGMGETVLLPYSLGDFSITSTGAKLLEIYV